MKTVLITGAGRGIGAAIAKRFAGTARYLLLHYYRSKEGVLEVARICEEEGARVHIFQADLSRVSEIEGMYKKIESLDLNPDVLINNAGIGHMGLVTETSEVNYDKLFSVNMKSTFFCTKIFLPSMIRRNYGRIVNVSSVFGMTGGAYEVLYSATKGAMLTFTKGLAKEVVRQGITVNAIAPGAVETDMVSGMTNEDRQVLCKEIPMGRLAQPEEIAEYAYFLSKPECAYLTGQIIGPTGGWLI